LKEGRGLREGGDDISDEAGIMGGEKDGRDDDIADGVVLGDDGFDFGEFDSVAAELDLRIDAAEEMEKAGVIEPGEVAGQVEASARRG